MIQMLERNADDYGNWRVINGKNIIVQDGDRFYELEMPVAIHAEGIPGMTKRLTIRIKEVGGCQ